MSLPKIACLQMTSSQDVQENLQSAAKLIQKAAKQDAQLVVLPEMFAVMGMDQRAALKEAESIGGGPIQDFLSQQALTHGIWLVGGTIPIITTPGAQQVNASCLVYNDQGQQIARYNKMHLFDVRLSPSGEAYQESATIAPGNNVVTFTSPIGKMGLGVCYDLRFPEFFRAMQADGVEMIILPAAFTYTTGLAHWEVLVRARAIENLAYMITSCQVGLHVNGRKTYGHSMIVDPWGEVKACLADGIGTVLADIDLAACARLRAEFPVLTHRKL